MKVKTSELSGKPLNYALAVAEWGPPTEVAQNGAFGATTFWWDHDGRKSDKIMTIDMYHEGFNPSENWSNGGPLIEKHDLFVGKDRYERYYAGLDETVMRDNDHILPAVCRVVVAIKFGDEVEIPNTLMGVA